MKYIYTNNNCVKCERQKAEWDKTGVLYEERDAERIKNPGSDSIDREALVQASMQNFFLPVIVDIDYA
jgi:glutaredoxin